MPYSKRSSFEPVAQRELQLLAHAAALVDDRHRLERALVLADRHAVVDRVVEALEGPGADEQQAARVDVRPWPPPAQSGSANGTASFSISVSSASCARMPATFGWPPTWLRILSTSSTNTRPCVACSSSSLDGRLVAELLARALQQPAQQLLARAALLGLLAEHVGVDAHHRRARARARGWRRAAPRPRASASSCRSPTSRSSGCCRP